jgi:DNA-binding IclR family transcriptional regulator
VKLADATGETVSLVVLEHGFGVYIIRENTANEPELGPSEGKFVPLHATAAGKAILACMSSEKRDDILQQQGIDSITSNTITNRDVLLDELDDIFDEQIAYDRGELQPDLYCLASPVVDADDRAVAAVSLSGPADRIEQKQQNADFPTIVRSTADSIRNRLAERS